MNTLDQEINKFTQPNGMYQLRLKTKKGELTRNFRSLDRATEIYKKLVNEDFLPRLYDKQGKIVEFAQDERRK